MRIFDAHFHIIDPRFPLVANQGFVPSRFTVDDYRARVSVDGGAVVSGSFQAYDQSYLADALGRLGAGFVGVAQIPPSISDEELVALDAAGVRAFRANLTRGGPSALDDFSLLAPRVAELGWHAEVYVPGEVLGDVAGRLVAAPRLVVDHLGGSAAGVPALLRLVEAGAWVKATRFGALDHDIPAVLRAVASINPSALLFGTDLPGTRAPRAYSPADLSLVLECAGERAVWENACALYLRRG